MKKIIRFVVVLLILAGIGAGIFFGMNQKEETAPAVYKETTVARGNVVAGITESGSVEIETAEQTYDLDFLSAPASSSGFSINANMGASSDEDDADNYLEVEAVYVAEGSVVNQGDALLKLTDESISLVRADLEKAVEDAKEALNEAKFDDEKTLMKAKHEYESSLAAGETAQWVLENTLKKLEQNVTDLEKQIEEIKEDIAETEEKFAELEAWNDGNNNEDYVDTKESLEKEKSDYEDKLAKLEMDLKQAKIDLTTGKVSAQETYDTTMFQYENAEYIYNKSVQETGKAADDANDDLEEAEENLKDFEAFVGNGIVTAAYTGTITSCGYAAGDSLSTSTSIAVFADPEKIAISVDVMQDDLSVVEIGGQVRIEFTAYPDESYTGTVKSIGDASTSSGTTSYPVTIMVDTYPERILSGMTGSVTFVTKEVSNVLYVSNKAVTRDGMVSYVKYYDELGNVVSKEVTTGFSNGTIVEISGDISEGDVLLIESKVGG